MINPVLKKELKTRMRTWKTPAMISLYAILICSLFFIIFIESFVNSRYGVGFRPYSVRTMYIVITIFQMLLIIFIVPAITSSSICGERERRTFDMLVGTRLSSFSIVLGKLMASLAQIVLLLIVSIPILSIMFLFGGFSPGNIIMLFLFYLVTAIYFGSIGIFTSTFFRKTTTSTIMSYLISLFLVGGTIIITVIWAEFVRSNLYGSQRPASFYPLIMHFNPFSGLSSILLYQMGENIFGGLLYTNQKSVALLNLYINVGVSLTISFILLFLSSLKINPMNKFGNWNSGKKRKKKKTKIK